MQSGQTQVAAPEAALKPIRAFYSFIIVTHDTYRGIIPPYLVHRTSYF
jgi:hypothetical protein